MIDLDQILTGLLKRTEQGKLKWSSTVQSDQFITSVDAISVVIFEAQNFYGFHIVDETGNIVESFGYEETTYEQDNKLERLYVLARRSALNIDSIMERLAKGLDL